MHPYNTSVLEAVLAEAVGLPAEAVVTMHVIAVAAARRRRRGLRQTSGAVGAGGVEAGALEIRHRLIVPVGQASAVAGAMEAAYRSGNLLQAARDAGLGAVVAGEGAVVR